jgi:hypothetical protein
MHYQNATFSLQLFANEYTIFLHVTYSMYSKTCLTLPSLCVRQIKCSKWHHFLAPFCVLTTTSFCHYEWYCKCIRCYKKKKLNKYCFNFRDFARISSSWATVKRKLGSASLHSSYKFRSEPVISTSFQTFSIAILYLYWNNSCLVAMYQIFIFIPREHETKLFVNNWYNASFFFAVTVSGFFPLMF